MDFIEDLLIKQKAIKNRNELDYSPNNKEYFKVH